MPVRQSRKPKTSKIKLTNTLTQNVDARMGVTADWLILIDTSSYAVAMVPYALAVEKATRVADGFEVQFEARDLHYVFIPTQYSPQHVLPAVSLKEEKSRIFQECIERF